FTGKSMVAFGLLEALASQSDRVGVFRPVLRSVEERDHAVDLLTSHPAVDQSYEDAIGVDHRLVITDPDTAHERILARHRELAERYSALVVLGSDYDDLGNPTELAFNAEVAANMGAPVVVVVSGLDRTPEQITSLAAVSVSEFTSHHALPIAVALGSPVVVAVCGRDRTPGQTTSPAAVSVSEFTSHHALPIAVVVNRTETAALEEVRRAVSAKLPDVLVAAAPENPVIMAP